MLPDPENIKIVHEIKYEILLIDYIMSVELLSLAITCCMLNPVNVILCASLVFMRLLII